MSKSSRKSIKSAVKKATRTSWSPPKEKHVKRLVLATFARDGIEEIITQLHRRFTKNNWVVILKTLMVFHKIMREGDQFFMESLKNKAHALFALRNFTGNPNNVYVIFVRKYAKYLDEKVSVFRLLNMQFEKHHDAFKTASVDALIKQVPKLQSQFNALLNCRLRGQYIGGNTLIIAALMMMLRDSLTVYPMLNSGVLALINVFTKLRRSEAEKVLEIYKLFVRETDALIAMYEVGRSFARNLPEINKVATHLIETFTKHIATLPIDDVPASYTSTNPSESVSFDEYIPEAEPAPYDLKDAFPGADSDSSASESSGEVDDDIMKGYDLRDSLPAGRPKPLTKQLSHGGESPAMPRKNLNSSGDWRKNSTGGASGNTSPKNKTPFETKVFSATTASNPSLDWGYAGNNQQSTIFSPPVQNNYSKGNNNASVDEFFSTAKSQPTMNPFVTPAQNPTPVQTGPLGVTITPQPTFDMMTHNFNTQLNLNANSQQRLSMGPTAVPNATSNGNLFFPTTGSTPVINPVPTASSNPFLMQGTGANPQVAATSPQKPAQQPSTYNPFV
jgi:hypothetical protein